MIFETLNESANRGELLLVDGGMCHWHLRRDGQLTIREIISTRKGAGSVILRRLEHTVGATSLFAKCPVELPANEWYTRRGFYVERMETTKTGRKLLCWRKWINCQEREPNVGLLEIIYCADGNKRFAEIALDAGFLYGAQFPPRSLPFRPYFADQDWKRPDRGRYMVKLAEYKPYMATVLDLERWEQLDEVLSWAEEAVQHVQVVVIIPKAHGIIAELPHTIGGKPVRLGYSVPTRYGGTTVQLAEFADWPGGVHLLGGSPEKQLELYHMLPVKSADANYANLKAMTGQYFERGNWITLAPHRDSIYEAFRRSCRAIMNAWRELTDQRKLNSSLHYQLHLWPQGAKMESPLP